ncbi:hypothetical protein ASPVEDRAFT_47018 [Aspergillus versicolor CBS 583.65]|uniref:Uncharacterized protein n=1 Tax=Aspergillus versicolor CBS 583.65 TaxID=1036611 RepID=A0A1L9Q211_ASPVE|nr:uncharacterized protein ASPVEDRAFT_47018 [Aspergillus versicolor CBS 583.65]OJJ07815.1 hypothetical protein ASPVEDRAFT_47018 [Aspergillus versicolor CBS 583.65]
MTLTTLLEDLLKCVECCKQQHNPLINATTIGAQNQNQSQNPEANRDPSPGLLTSMI